MLAADVPTAADVAGLAAGELVPANDSIAFEVSVVLAAPELAPSEIPKLKVLLLHLFELLLHCFIRLDLWVVLRLAADLIALLVNYWLWNILFQLWLALSLLWLFL